jgi:hypothetical protein
MKWRVVYAAGDGYQNDILEIERTVEAETFDGAMLDMERAIRDQPMLNRPHMRWVCKRATVLLDG